MTDISLPRTTGRVALAAGAAAFLAFGLAAPAAADDATHRYNGHAEQSGETVYMDGRGIGTNLFKLDNLETDDSLTMYCIDFRTNIRSGAGYSEDAWSTYPGLGDFTEVKSAKVHWILQNGYPTVSADELAERADVRGRLSERKALAATQAAIWHFSNDVDLDGRNQPEVKELYDYFLENAEELPQEPTPTLTVTPEEASGNAGETVGEFSIETNASEAIDVALNAPEDVALVDIDSGEAVTEVSNGDVVGFSVPEGAEAGEASFSLETTAVVQTGRLFRGTESEPTQTLITATEGEDNAVADASVSWAAVDEPEPTPTPEPEPTPTPDPTETPDPKPTPTDEPEDDKPTPEDDEPSLPVTGGALAGLVAAGVAALGAGGGALYFSRKRKAAALDGDEG